MPACSRDSARDSLRRIVAEITRGKNLSPDDDDCFLDLGLTWFQVLNDLLDNAHDQLGVNVDNLDPSSLTVGELLDLVPHNIAEGDSHAA